MILLLGATGFIGQAFARELRRRRELFVPLSRSAFDYTRFDLLFDYVRRMRPAFVINAAQYIGQPELDGCEVARVATFQANTVLPQTIARICEATNTPWGHVSAGCIYCGAKVYEGGAVRIERDLNRSEVKRLFEAQPDRFLGFSELEEPNFTFRSAGCNFYSGTKALAEEALLGTERVYVWRVQRPFSNRDDPCNWLATLPRQARVYDEVTSLSHLDECVRACLELRQIEAPFGIYNVVNPGAVTIRQVAAMLRGADGGVRVRFWRDDGDYYRDGPRALRSSCILDGSRLEFAGVKLRPVSLALEQACQQLSQGREMRGGGKRSSMRKIVPLIRGETG